MAARCAFSGKQELVSNRLGQRIEIVEAYAQGEVRLDATAEWVDAPRAAGLVATPQPQCPVRLFACHQPGQRPTPGALDRRRHRT
jgi:hypothetical protein